MEIRFAAKKDIDGWMALVERVREEFPGLETPQALAQHRAAVLQFIAQSSAICATEGDRIAGALLFSAQRGEVCFLAVDPRFRRRQLARGMFGLMLSRMPAGRDITLVTYREGDPAGQAARAFYRRMGFFEGRLLEAFGHPVQELVLRRAQRPGGAQ